MAKEKGLEPLAEIILKQESKCDPVAVAEEYVDEEKALQMLKMHCKAQWILLRKRFRIMRKSESA